MSKEFDRFVVEYDRLKPALAKVSVQRTKELTEEIMSAMQYVEGNTEPYVIESAAKARANGVTDPNPAVMLKDKDVAEAVRAFRAPVGALVQKVRALETYSLDADALRSKLAMLQGKIDKDLKTRTGRSASKTDIEKLLVTVKSAMAVLGKAAAQYGTLDSSIVKYGAQQDRRIAELLTKDAAAQQRQYDNTMLPQVLSQRQRTQALARARKLRQQIAGACDAAVALAATDVPAAKTSLQPAINALPILKKLSDEYTAAFDLKDKDPSANRVKEFRENRDYAAIKQALADFQDAYASANKKLHETAATLRAAG